MSTPVEKKVIHTSLLRKEIIRVFQVGYFQSAALNSTVGWFSVGIVRYLVFG